MSIKNCFLFFCALCAVVVAVPSDVAAYFTKAQSAVALEDGKGVLYSVTYEFGTEKYDLYLPIIPERKSDTADQARTLTYALVEDGRESSYGTSLGVVVSNAEIRNGHYFIPKGTAKRMTLITLLLLPQTLIHEPHDIALQVTNLPFTMDKQGQKVEAQLNPSELQYYTTPEVGVPKGK